MDINFLRHFNLSSVTIKPLHGENVYSVKATEGQFILKNIPKNDGRLKRLLKEHRLLDYLYAAGVPVACPMETIEGYTYIECKNCLYVLMPKLSHCPADFFSSQSQSIYMEIGHSIAHIHKVMASYPEDIKNYTIDPYHVIYQEIVPELYKDNIEKEHQKIIEILTEQQNEMHEVFTGLPLQLIHGDCHTGNVCITGNRVTGYIDCDHLPFAPRLYDLCYYLIHIIKWDLDDIEKVNIFLSLYPYMIEGYNSIAPLTEKERQSFWYMLLYIQLLFYYYKMKNDNNEAIIDLSVFWWVYNNQETLKLPYHP